MAFKCWICGNTSNPSSEHKFKASDLRNEFGSNAMVKFNDESLKRGKGIPMQGVKSRHAKFSKTICESCNTNVTQKSDRAFEEFSELANSLVRQGYPPEVATIDTEFADRNSEKYKELFRFFAKLVGCHAAEDGWCPIPTNLRDFVLRKSDRNQIWLNLTANKEYQSFGVEGGFVSAGAFAITFYEETLWPKAYLTSYSTSKLHFEFRYEFTEFEIMKHFLLDPHILKKCRDTLDPMYFKSK